MDETLLAGAPGIKNRILRSGPVKWRDLQFIQHADFKEISPEDFEKLLASLRTNDFVESFKVWEDPGTGVPYCLDGFHRCKGLRHLADTEGVQVPDEFSADFLDCADKQEAAQLVLIYSSRYAKVTEQGLADFLNLNSLKFDLLAPSIDIPDINLGDFEENYIKSAAGGFTPAKQEKDPFDDPGVSYTQQYGVIVLCADEETQKAVYERLTGEGMNCKIVVT